MRERKTLTTVNSEEGMDQNGLLSAQQLYIFLKHRNEKVFLINLVLDTYLFHLFLWIIWINLYLESHCTVLKYNLQSELVEVHGIILSLLVHMKNKSKCQYYFVLQKSFLNCLDEWDFVSTQVSWGHQALLLSSF